MAPGRRSFLTPEQRIEVAYAHYILGIDQTKLGILFRVNHGRITEACKAIELAARAPKRVRPYRKAGSGRK